MKTSIFSLPKRLVKLLMGSSTALKLHQKHSQANEDYVSTIEIIKSRIDPTLIDENQSPIFIFSAGWRSGSTLLQRLLSSDKDVFFWGEPYDRCNYIQSMADSLDSFYDNWPPKKYIVNESGNDNLSNTWVANLYPTENALLLAHYGFLNTLFAKTPKQYKAFRWGLKEVRFGFKEAVYLNFLYPNGKFVYLYRDLKDAYTSYLSFRNIMDWYSRWPTKKVFTPFSFAKNRATLLSEFKLAQKYTNGVLISYEDVVNNESTHALEDLEKYCDIQIDKSILNKKVGSRKTTDIKQQYSVSVLENMLLDYGHRVGTDKNKRNKVE